MKNNQSLQNFNTDLRLIRSLSAHKSSQELTHPRSVQQLAALLKLKKQQQPHRPHQMQSGRQWLIKKGINLEPLVTRVTQLKKQVIQTKSTKEAQSYFHVDFNSQSTEDYLSRAEQYASMNLMQSIMSRAEHRKRSTNKLLQSVIGQNAMFTAWQCQSTTETRNSYIEITKEIVKNQQQAINISRRMLQQFRLKFMTAEQNSLWEILAYQLNTYSPSAKQPANMTRMLISSLKLIQQQFERKIHGQDFDRFVNHYYLSRVDHKTLENKGSLWPKVWLAYCANQKNKVQNLLASQKRNHRDLMHLYQLNQQSILNGRPSKHSYAPQYDIEDIFYQQFIYNITGQSRYAHALFADETSLELILIVVSTLGIFYQSQKNKFEEVRSKVVSKYRDLGADVNMMRHILYLLDYTTILKMGANALMSRQDYLHFLIIVAGFPDLVPQNILKTNLAKHLVSFIIQLINQKRNEYVYYIQLIPEDMQVEETSSIIVSVDGLDSFDWKMLRLLVGEQQYHRIVVATIEKYSLRQGVELKAAVKLVQLCEDYRRAYDCLLTLFINYYLHKTKYPKEILSKAQQLGLDWSNEYGLAQIQNGISRITAAYRMLFYFIVSIRELNTHIIARDTAKLKDFIAHCEFIVLKLNQPHSLYEQMLKILNQNSGLELYYYFLRLVVKGAEIYSVRVADSQKLQVLKSILREQVQTIQHFSWLRREFQSSNLTQLNEMLKDYVINLVPV